MIIKYNDTIFGEWEKCGNNWWRAESKDPYRGIGFIHSYDDKHNISYIVSVLGGDVSYDICHLYHEIYGNKRISYDQIPNAKQELDAFIIKLNVIIYIRNCKMPTRIDLTSKNFGL